MALYASVMYPKNHYLRSISVMQVCSILLISLSTLLTLAKGCCLDVDWLTEDIFASCGADGQIQITRLDSAAPIRTLTLVHLLPL